MVARGRGSVTADPDVLVVGAGPTGLTTALQAHALGASVRLVERRPEAFRPSRAMIMHSRTLECLRPLGVADSLLDRGDRSPRAELHLGQRRVRAQLAEVALPDTAFPHLTMLRQMDVEEVLAAALASRGVEVERGVEVVDASARGGRAWSLLRRGGGTEETSSRFLAGCDGQSSTLRGLTGIAWRGGSYREEVVLADAELDGDLEPGLLHVAAARQGLLFLFALGEGATWRILATRPSRGGEVPFGQPGPTVPAAEIQQILDVSGLEATLSDLRWSARVRLQHRLAGAFRQGPFFLAGDAAHTHSPAAAQGMNTGILDAVNLGWKLAFASSDADHTLLLDSYEAERRPVARQVLAMTHLVFFAEASANPVPSFLRGTLVPLVAPAAPLLLQQRVLVAHAVRLLSQGWVRYRNSAISVDRSAGHRRPRPGDRLPDEEVLASSGPTRLHDLTARPGAHLLLERNAGAMADVRLGPHVFVHRISSWPGHGLVGVRPDGHVGFRCDDATSSDVGAWLDLVGARQSRYAGGSLT